jgi:GNAT superfamily N-acetyltransferase
MERTITVCPPGQVDRALDVLFASMPGEQRRAMVASVGSGLRNDPASNAGIFIALDRGHLRGAVLVQEQPGKTAIVWPPGTRPADESVAAQLLDVADQYLNSRGTVMAQALLNEANDPASTTLEAIGFARLTDLDYLIAPMHSVKATRMVGEIQFEPFDQSQQGRLAALVEETYIESLDCPELNGVRQIEDVLTGYQATGAYDPGRWYFVSHEAQDVGVLLLSEHPLARQWELVYMGLVPRARGKGFGRAMVEFALNRALSAGVESIVLAVDADNHPARKLYRQCGFCTWIRRVVFWKAYCGS